MTQNEAILKDLLEGKRITSLEAWVMYGCSALNSRISNLRHDMNIPVSDVWINVVGKDGEVKHVKQYFITEEDINKINQSKKAA